MLTKFDLLKFDFHKLHKSLVTSISSTVVKHEPCSVTLKQKHRLLEPLEVKLLRISFLEDKTNDWVRNKINFLAGPQEPFLAIVKRRELAWFGHFTRHDSLSRTILQGTLESGRRRGQQRKF